MRRAAPVGASSLLVIFSVLCLTIFALLSLSTVRVNGQLAARGVQGAEEYYAADCAAEEILAQLRCGVVPQTVRVEGDLYRYQVPLSETAHLDVALRLEGEHATILRWQMVSDAAWEPEQGLAVWDGAQ